MQPLQCTTLFNFACARWMTCVVDRFAHKNAPDPIGPRALFPLLEALGDTGVTGGFLPLIRYFQRKLLLAVVAAPNSSTLASTISS